MARAAAPPLITGVLILSIGVILPPYFQFVGGLAAQQAILGLSIGVVYNLAGMVSLAQVSLSAIGAWATIALSQTLLPEAYPWTAFIAGVVAVPIGILVGLPALRLRGISLAIVTLGFVVIVYQISSIGLIPGSTPLDFLEANSWTMSNSGFYMIAWTSFTVLAVLFAVVKQTWTGLTWIAIASSERAAASLGVRVLTAKLTAFGFSAFIAGCGGAVLVAAFGTTNADSFSAVTAMTMFVLAVMVGAGHWEGALFMGLLGAVVGAILRQFDLPADLSALVFAVGAIDILSRGKGGLSELLRHTLGRLRQRPTSASPTATTSARMPGTRVAELDRVVLEVDALTVRYGTIAALDGVSLSIAKGEVHGIVGPNGAGKSTLVDTITGFVPDYTGQVRIDGVELTGMPPQVRSRSVRRTFQQDRAVSALSAMDYLRLAAHGRSSAEELVELLDWVGCPDITRLICDLDTRQRRNLMIAAAVAGKPRVILLDEPAAGLTESESIHLAELVREMPLRFDVSVGIIEHDLDLVRAVCDRVTVLDFGRVLATGPTDTVLREPAVVRAYMGDLDAETSSVEANNV
jgi:branched-chain amino acid transport system permease protein